MYYIEHNMDVIKQADHIIDLGLKGGKNGGDIIMAELLKRLLIIRQVILQNI